MAGLPPDGSPAEDESMTAQSMYSIAARRAPIPLHERPLCLLCIRTVEGPPMCTHTHRAPLRAAGAGVTVSGLDGDEGAGTSDESNELGSMEELRKRGCWGCWTGQGLAPGGGGCSPDEPKHHKGDCGGAGAWRREPRGKDVRLMGRIRFFG